MIKIIVVGKLTQKYLKTGIEHYEKQIPQKVAWIEVQDEASASGLDKEGARILKHIHDQDYVFLLAIEGQNMDSVGLSSKLSEIMTYQAKPICFVIGGSYGVSQAIYERANEHLSFSKMTFPHQLMRLMLIEQIYRAFMIQKNHPYHK